MAAISKFAASAISATNENTFGLANFNIDFSLIKVEAPVEYSGLRSALSTRRVENAEQGPLHRTARRLGALFEQILPSIKSLAEVYGRRASEIAGSEKIGRKGTPRDGPFASHVGFDGTSIYAAATSGSSAIAVHLLACLLARTWSGPEATAIWVELVAERKKDIVENMDPSQIQGMAARVAAQQEISRADLATWDASARAWLLSADEVQKFNLTQLRLIIKDCGLLAGSTGSTYASVIDVWTVAMKTLQDLILGMPQRISRGALLVGLSSWHIFPDLNVVGPIAHVKFNDNLVDEGGIITLGLQSALPHQSSGVQWSLSLSHLRYYGEPVKVSTSMGPNGSRISMEELHMVALGSVFGSWGPCITDAIAGAEMMNAIVSCLEFKTEHELKHALPHVHLLWCASKRLLNSSQVDRQSALCLVAFGRRRAQKFLVKYPEKLVPAFGFANPRLAWKYTRNPEKYRETTIIKEVEELREFAGLCGYSSDECVIRYSTEGTPSESQPGTPATPGTPGTKYEYTTAIPYCQHLRKRNLDNEPKSTLSHTTWVFECAKTRAETLSRPCIAPRCEFVDKSALIEEHADSLIWHQPPNHFSEGHTPVTFRCIAGDFSKTGLFCKEAASSKEILSDNDIVRIPTVYGLVSLRDLHDGFGTLTYDCDHIGWEEEVFVSEKTHLKVSLTRLARAGSLYQQLPGATVSISVVDCPMYKAKCCEDLSVALSAKFACIAMFETGSSGIQAEQLAPVMALCSGNSIYVANALLQDPIKPNSYGTHGITRIVGNIDHGGVVMLAPPQAPLVRDDDPNCWHVINHHRFDGKIESYFAETSLHLSFTEYEVPLSVPVGAIDAEVSMMETLVSTHDRKEWVADLDILASLRDEKSFKRILPPHCIHTGFNSRPGIENAAVQIGRITKKQLVSIDSWEELLDPPEGLGETQIGVVRACNNWHARVAALSVSVQKGLRTVVLPTEPLCTVCGVDAFRNMGSFAQIMIL